MPLYEYVCANCGNRFTLLQSMSASREGNICPNCGKKQTRRLMSSFSACGESTDSAAGCGPGSFT